MRQFKKYAQYYDRIYTDKPYKKEIKFVYKWANKPKSILDIGAGTGNYWKYFPKRVELLGIEKSHYMINQSEYKEKITQLDICEADNQLGDILNTPVFDCATALFHVINYLPSNNWWKKLPLKKRGYFIFSIWDKNKVNKYGFQKTEKTINEITRCISPLRKGNKVTLRICVETKENKIQETHTMYLYSRKDIKTFCGKEYKIVDIKETAGWTLWYKIEKR